MRLKTVLTFLLLLCLILCSCSKSTISCRYCSAPNDPSKDYCADCGQPLSAVRPDGYMEADPPVPEETKSSNEICGAWIYLDEGREEAIVYSLTENGVANVINAYSGSGKNRGTIMEIFDATCKITDNELTITTDFGSKTTRYQLSNNNQTLTLYSSDDNLILTRISPATNIPFSVLGEWKTVISFGNPYDSITFYNDGSVKAVYDGSVVYKEYKTLLDGGAVTIGDKYGGETHDIMYLPNGLMIFQSKDYLPDEYTYSYNYLFVKN